MLQQPMTILFDQGWDIESYIAIVQQFDNGERLHHAAPFVYRFGTGLLASSIPFGDVYQRYLIVGILANAATLVLFVRWLEARKLAPWSILIAAMMLVTTWHSPIRAVYYAPQGPDALFLTIIIASLLWFERLKHSISHRDLLLFSLFIAASVCVRETSLLIAIAFLFLGHPIRRVKTDTRSYFTMAWPPIKRWLPLFIGVATLVAIRLMISQNNQYEFADAALIWLYNKPFVMYLQGLLLSFGPVLLLLPFCWTATRVILLGDQHLVFLLIAIFGLAWFGGTDTERIVYWSAPIVYMVVGKLLMEREELRYALILIVLGIGQLLVQRVFWLTPDIIAPNPFRYPILAVQGHDVQHPHLRAWHNDRAITVISALQLGLFSVFLWIALNRARSKVKG